MTEQNSKALFLNKTCKIHINKGGKSLVFTAEILSYDNTQIVFKDRYGEIYAFNSTLIEEISLGGQN